MPPAAEKDGTVILEGPEFHHCARVCRFRTGDMVKLLDGHGGTYEARVMRIGARNMALEIHSRQEAPALLPVDIALAMIKGPRFDLAVEKCAELGVRRLIPFTSKRCVWRGSGDGSRAALDRIRRKIIASCKQSGQPYFPQIDAPSRLDALMERFSLYTVVYLAEQHSAMSASGPVDAGAGPFLGIVGPEGGLTPEEREGLVARGVVSLSLGSARLRSETAVICLAYRLLSGFPSVFGK